MIVCHRYKFIFLKTRKTAGTSIEIALSKFCDKNDVITPISEADEDVRRSLGHQGPVNYYYPLIKHTKVELLRSALTAKRKRAYNHMSAHEVRFLVGERKWREYFKFTVERNPWDKVVSKYFWHYKNSDAQMSFSDFVRAGPVNIVSNFDLYSIDGRIAVDRIIRYEDLPNEIRNIAEHLSFPEIPEIPKTKANSRVGRQSHRFYYTERDRDIVAKMFAREIAEFGYEF